MCGLEKANLNDIRALGSLVKARQICGYGKYLEFFT